MRKRAPIPKPWWQVGLAVLPGLIFLDGQVSEVSESLDTGFRYLALGIMILLTVSSVVLAAVRRSPFRVPVWGLVPLGLFAGVGSIWTIEYLGFYPTCLLLIAVGLLFARENGASAALFVVTSGMIATSWTTEPGMYFWDSPFWRAVINIGMTTLFTIVEPIFVLRARSVLGQAAGLLVPVFAYYATFAYGKNVVNGIPISRSISVRDPLVALLVTVAIAALVYEMIASRGFTKGAAHSQVPSG